MSIHTGQFVIMRRSQAAEREAAVDAQRAEN